MTYSWPDLTIVSADTVKNVILFYYRFKKQYPYIATEWLDCDVIASDGKSLIEVEVKISWQDYLKEFKKKKYNPKVIERRNKFRLTPRAYKYDPNRRYFAAPRELAERIVSDTKHNFGHGVIAVDAYGQCIVLRRAKQLHKEPVKVGILNSIVSRMASELLTLRQNKVSQTYGSENEI